eukprot:5502416-Amphidinium_carterae.1
MVRQPLDGYHDACEVVAPPSEQLRGTLVDAVTVGVRNLLAHGAFADQVIRGCKVLKGRGSRRASILTSGVCYVGSTSASDN